MLPLNYGEDKQKWGRQAFNYFETIMLGRRYTSLTYLSGGFKYIYIYFYVYKYIYIHIFPNYSYQHFCSIDILKSLNQ